ncbi:MAG: hypothetical protein AAAC48_14655 [Phyllobacterium sp.]|uniref:hypothetical protein n=1 Tax=Phyllobacterium sp. TaxID=1871046 RepID=UPI0030EFFE27
MREAKITFIGPISVESRITANGRRVVSYYFLLLQAGGDPLKLEYPDMASAVGSRKQLLKSSVAQNVGSAKLLKAIHQAMQAILEEAGVEIPAEWVQRPQSP